MTGTRSATALLCRLHLHRNTLVNDGNPENRRAMHLECTRCGRVQDTPEYEARSGARLAKITMTGL